MKIGLIGLGIMGKPMAKNLLKAGYDLTVNDRSQASVEDVVAAGARYATQQEIGERCDVVLTMLPNSPQVKEVMLAEDGVASHMKPGTVFIDMSSINPVASQEIASMLAEKGVEMLDAPVSGGEPKAIDGTLSFMVGGKQEIFETYSQNGGPFFLMSFQHPNGYRGAVVPIVFRITPQQVCHTLDTAFFELCLFSRCYPDFTQIHCLVPFSFPCDAKTAKSSTPVKVEMLLSHGINA